MSPGLQGLSQVVTGRRRKMKKKFNLMQGEGGQIFIFSIIIMMMAALIIPPILGLTYSSGQTVNIRKERMQVLYTADTGIQDALYTLDNLGNGTSLKVPADIGTETWYPLTVKQSDLDSDAGVKIEKDGNN